MASRQPNEGPRPRRRKAVRRGWNPLLIGASIAAGVLIVGVALAALYFAKGRRGEPRLVGTWQSDADATITEMRKARPVTAEQERFMRTLFGRMKVTYTATTFSYDLDGQHETQPLRIVSKDHESVVVKFRVKQLDREMESRIRFVGTDTYWVDTPELSPVSECFRRIE